MQLEGFSCNQRTVISPLQMCTTSLIKLSSLALGVINYTVLLVCRAVYVAIPVCVVGVVFITQPSWLGGGTHPRSALGIILAIGQVGHELRIAIIELHYISLHHITSLTSHYITLHHITLHYTVPCVVCKKGACIAYKSCQCLAMLMQCNRVLEQCVYSAVRLAFVSLACESAVVTTPESVALTQLWMQPGLNCFVYSSYHLKLTTLLSQAVQAVDTLHGSATRLLLKTNAWDSRL